MTMAEVRHVDVSTRLAIGELAARTGVATSALRYYEDLGLIFSERNPAGHRRYLRATARRVAFITFAQRVGLSLDEIGHELAKLPKASVPTADDWGNLTTIWRTRIDDRIAELQRLRNSLTSCIGCGCLSLDRCAVMNPDDLMGENGPGPRFWEGDPKPKANEAS